MANILHVMSSYTLLGHIAKDMAALYREFGDDVIAITHAKSKHRLNEYTVRAVEHPEGQGDGIVMVDITVEIIGDDVFERGRKVLADTTEAGGHHG